MITFPGALFILFLALKLCGVIGWSWWWVTAPVWGCFVWGALAVAAQIRKELRQS